MKNMNKNGNKSLIFFFLSLIFIFSFVFSFVSFFPDKAEALPSSLRLTEEERIYYLNAEVVGWLNWTRDFDRAVADADFIYKFVVPAVVRGMGDDERRDIRKIRELIARDSLFRSVAGMERFLPVRFYWAEQTGGGTTLIPPEKVVKLSKNALFLAEVEIECPLPEWLARTTAEKYGGTYERGTGIILRFLPSISEIATELTKMKMNVK